MRLSAWLAALGLASGLHIGCPVRQGLTRAAVSCCAAPVPALRDAEGFARGLLEQPEGSGVAAAWRQDPLQVQLVVRMPEDCSFRRDVGVELSRKRISLVVAGVNVLVGELAHDVAVDESDWYVEEDLDGFSGEGGYCLGAAEEADARYLVVALRKRESYIDWDAPLRGEASAGRKLRIGGKGDAQKKATAQQIASFQILVKLPTSISGDVYARVPPKAATGKPSKKLYYVGRIIAESADAVASLAAQEVLVKEHARLYRPLVFGDASDDAIELWLAPGKSVMAVAQNEIALSKWEPPGDEVALPVAGACGFDPETAPSDPRISFDPFVVRRDAEGQPLGKAFKANVVKPDEVPGAYEAWLKDQ